MGIVNRMKVNNVAIVVVRLVIDDKCQISFAEIPRRITYEFYFKRQLIGVFNLLGQSMFEVIKAAYQKTVE
jgi:hypothetical protein